MCSCHADGAQDMTTTFGRLYIINAFSIYDISDLQWVFWDFTQSETKEHLYSPRSWLACLFFLCVSTHTCKWFKCVWKQGLLCHNSLPEGQTSHPISYQHPPCSCSAAPINLAHQQPLLPEPQSAGATTVPIAVSWDLINQMLPAPTEKGWTRVGSGHYEGT